MRLKCCLKGGLCVNNNSVLFKGRHGGINIVLDDKLDFEELKRAFDTKVKDAGDFFNGAKGSVTFSGRDLSEKEESELLDIISSSKLNISFVDKKPKSLRKNKENIEYLISATDNLTHFHMNGLRNGQEIRYGGSVVVIGDVNPGAEIIAEGNVIVIGSLYGLVHAGCNGNADCFIAALNLSPTQLRISDIITYIPDEHKRLSKKTPSPSYAFVKDGVIYVAPLGHAK